jgi:hypothetical protein
MKRLAALLLAALCLLGALFALSCGSGGDNEPAASPTSKSAVAEETPAATSAAKTATARKTPAPTPSVEPIVLLRTAVPTDDEPTRHFELLQLCLGVNDESWRQVCAATASKDIAKCGQMPSTGPVEKVDMQAVCAFFVAAATIDTAICDDIQTVAPGFDSASFALGEYGADCYMYVAVASKNAALCAGTQSPAGCERNIAVAEGAVPLDDCNDIDCLFDYALRNRSSEACEKLGAMGEQMRVSCEVMLSGDPALCDSIEGIGVTERTACISRALYGQARAAPGGFEFSVCGDDVICLFRALHDMANYIAGG